MTLHHIEDDLGPDVAPSFLGRLERDTILEAEHVLWAEAKMDAASHPKPISPQDDAQVEP